MWTAASFNSYTLLYSNKYLEGDIYLNYYFDGLAGIIAYLIAAPLYQYCKIRNSFITSYIITLLGLLGIFLFESDLISPYIISTISNPSPYPPGDPKEKAYYLKQILPTFTFLAKIGAHITFANSYQASFVDPKTFPLLKRGTAIGICNMVSRTFTAFSPLTAELDKPIPVIIMIFVTLIGEIVAMTFPSPREERLMQLKILRDKGMMNKSMMGSDNSYNSSDKSKPKNT